MYARATTMSVPREQQDAAVEQYRAGISRFREMPGNKGAFLLVDRNTGRGIAVTVWESEEAIAESRERANELRQQAAQESGGDVLEVQEYEIAIWDVDAG